jgi:hypothetical protein
MGPAFTGPFVFAASFLPSRADRWRAVRDETVCLTIPAKGRDFYDAIFLLGQTPSDYTYLSAKCDIHNLSELKAALIAMLAKVNLEQKSKDFEHLLFSKQYAKMLLSFGEFVNGLQA